MSLTSRANNLIPLYTKTAECLRELFVQGDINQIIQRRIEVGLQSKFGDAGDENES